MERSVFTSQKDTSTMIDKVKEQYNICKIHWKEIMALSFMMHFIFDWFIFGLGVLLGMHIGH